MPPSPHLVVDISGHGYGHLGQVAPVLDALRVHLPDLRLTLRTSVAPHILQQSVDGAFAVAPPPLDFGMLMAGPLDVDAGRSFEAYRTLFADWDCIVADEAQQLADLSPDLLLADVPFTSLAGAAAAGIRSVALCSLNWAEVLKAYCGDRPGIGSICDSINEAYDSAAVFLQAQPHIPMEALSNRQSIGPLARVGRDRRAEIAAQIGQDGERRLVLVSMGGIPGKTSGVPLPPVPGVTWITPSEWTLERDDILSRRSLDIPFIDLMRSCDAVVTKIGYGIFVECACNATRLLYSVREGWPELPYLEAWADERTAAVGVTREALEEGTYGPDLKALLKRLPPPVSSPTGIGQAVEALLPLLEHYVIR